MARKKGNTKQITVEVEKGIFDNMNEIIKRTGELKRDLIARLLVKEHKLITENKTNPDSLNTSIIEIENILKTISKDFPKTLENTTATRSASNMLYAILIYAMKEIYRLSSSLHILYMKTGSINESNRKEISDDSDKLAASQFNIFLDQCLNETVINIEKMLRKE